MKTLRLALTVGAAVFLAGGYAASQWAFFQGESAAHGARMDAWPIRLFAAIFLGSAIILMFVKPKGDEE